jgi:hypothetical protein
MLHRPFRSVAELGYVFSGTPWKNIDFFTPQSGDAALLDVFTAYETPVAPPNTNPLIAGVVDLNTRQAPVLQALLANAYVDEAAMTGTGSSADQAISQPLTATQANSILTTSSNLLARTAGTASGQGPLVNVGDLVGRWSAALVSGNIPFSGDGTVTSGTNYATGYSGPSGDLTNVYANAFSGASATVQQTMENVDRFREAFIRPLAAVGNTRVWNLMIDLIAQTGRYPQSATGPANFVVDGEQRYWVHVAIDRFTGQILDKQVEVVRN